VSPDFFTWRNKMKYYNVYYAAVDMDLSWLDVFNEYLGEWDEVDEMVESLEAWIFEKEIFIPPALLDIPDEQVCAELIAITIQHYHPRKK